MKWAFKFGLFNLILFAVAFFVTPVELINRSYALTSPRCVDIFTSDLLNAPTPIESLFDRDAQLYIDNYDSRMHRKYFWRYHKRFGLVRTVFNRLVLIAKDPALAQQLIEDLSAYSGQSSSLAQPARAPGWFFQRGTAYDVTAMLPGLEQARFEVPGKSNGPNCLNACLVLAQHSESLIYSSPKELSNWLQVPFAKQITDTRDLQPGDILIFKGITERASHIEHAAIYISPRLVLSKNGMDASKPLRLMDINEVAGMYLKISPEDKANYADSYYRKVSAYRLFPIDDVLAKRSIVLPELFLQAQSEINELANQVAQFHQYGGNLKQLKRELDQVQLKWRGTLYSEADKIENSDLNPDRKNLWLILWHSLSLRLKSIEDSLRSAQH